MMLLGIPFLALILALILGRDLPSEWLNSALFVYVAGAFVSIHPFIALQLTDSQLSSGSNPFYSTITLGSGLGGGGRNQIVVPSPWLA